MTNPPKRHFRLHPDFVRGTLKPIESVEDAISVLKRIGKGTSNPHTEGRKFAALRHLWRSDDPEAWPALIRFKDVTVNYPNYRKRPKARTNYDPASKARGEIRQGSPIDIEGMLGDGPSSGGLGRRRGPVLGGAPGLGKSRKH